MVHDVQLLAISNGRQALSNEPDCKVIRTLLRRGNSQYPVIPAPADENRIGSEVPGTPLSRSNQKLRLVWDVAVQIEYPSLFAEDWTSRNLGVGTTVVLWFVVSHPSTIRLWKDGAPIFWGQVKGGPPAIPPGLKPALILRSWRGG